MTLLHDYIPAAYDPTLTRLPQFKAPSLSDAALTRLSQSEAPSVSDVTLTRPSQSEERPPSYAHPPPSRARWANVMVSKYTPNLINAVEEEAKAAGRLMKEHHGKMIVIDIWPFLPRYSNDSAWPQQSGSCNGPLLVYFGWGGAYNDKIWIDQMKRALDHIRDVALKEGCTTSDAPVYYNTTLADPDVTTPQEIYRHNLADLSALRAKYDPHNVMSLAGGFRIPHGPAIANGTYIICNAANVSVGVVGPFGPIIGDRITTFRIFPIPGMPEVYTIDNHIDNQDHFATEMGDNAVVCQTALVMPGRNTWKIIPEFRRRNQLEYRILNLYGSECWVLRRPFRQSSVQCIPVGEVEDANIALWRFNNA